jgi:glutamate racemase
VDALVLGCTHYPILRDVIQETVGSDVRLIDSGEAAAESVEALLRSEELRRAATGSSSSFENGAEASPARSRQMCDDMDHFYVTDAAERFARVAERFLGCAPRVLEAVEVWGHDEFQTRQR